MENYQMLEENETEYSQLTKTAGIEMMKESQKEGNLILGVCLAILGAILGSVIWILISYAGFIAAIGGLAILFGAMKGFTLSKCEMTKKSLVFCLVLTLLAIPIANGLSLATELYLEWKEEYEIVFWDALYSIPYLLEDPEVRRMFLSDLGMGYFLTIIGVAKTVADVWKSSAK